MPAPATPLGPTLGKLTDSLRAVGVAPERIDTILLTHVHSDHSNGLVDDDGRAVYPNAQLLLHEAEAAFWLDRDEASGANERIRRNIAKARVTTAPYRDAHAHRARWRGVAGRVGGAARRPYPGSHRLAHPIARRAPADLGRSRFISRRSRSRAPMPRWSSTSIRRRPARRAGACSTASPPTSSRSPAPTWISRLRRHRAQGHRLRLRTGCVRTEGDDRVGRSEALPTRLCFQQRQCRVGTAPARPRTWRQLCARLCPPYNRKRRASTATNRKHDGGMHARISQQGHRVRDGDIAAVLLAAPLAQAQERGPLALASASYFFVGGKIDPRGRRQSHGRAHVCRVHDPGAAAAIPIRS